MPPRHWPQRVQDIVDEAARILRHVEGVDWDRFKRDESLQGDVLFRFSIIAAARVGDCALPHRL